MSSALSLVLLLPALLAAHAAETSGPGGNLSNCKGGCPANQTCIANGFIQPVQDWECEKCVGDQDWWPCNFETVCYCNSDEEGAPRVPPAPKSGEEVIVDFDVCKEILTKEIFKSLVDPRTAEGKDVYTYQGFCKAVAQYNSYHEEKFASMGSEEQIRAELAAFFAHTAVDTDGYALTREELHCVDPITGTDGNVYCRPCLEKNYNEPTKYCSRNYFETEDSYTDYCDITKPPPHGCPCNMIPEPDIVPVAANSGVTNTLGYIAASRAFFTRGALQTSSNRDYYAAGLSLSGKTSTLCDNPDLVSTNPRYAWGVGIYKWMEKMLWGSWGPTAHHQALDGNFGGTINVLYGDLECPAYEFKSVAHVKMLHRRIGEICRAGAALGVFLEMNNCTSATDCLQCEGITEIHTNCQLDGSCPFCPTWEQFVMTPAPSISLAPSSAPSNNTQLVESQGTEWWVRQGGSESSAYLSVPLWSSISLAYFALFSAGFLFV